MMLELAKGVATLSLESMGRSITERKRASENFARNLSTFMVLKNTELLLLMNEHTHLE
jgi:hypothetical protein